MTPQERSELCVQFMADAVRLVNLFGDNPAAMQAIVAATKGGGDVTVSAVMTAGEIVVETVMPDGTRLRLGSISAPRQMDS